MQAGAARVEVEVGAGAVVDEAAHAVAAGVAPPAAALAGGVRVRLLRWAWRRRDVEREGAAGEEGVAA